MINEMDTSQTTKANHINLSYHNPIDVISGLAEHNVSK